MKNPAFNRLMQVEFRFPIASSAGHNQLQPKENPARHNAVAGFETEISLPYGHFRRSF